MSHQPERKEKDCLNCGEIVQGRYCQNCGQENIVVKQNFWHLVTHFIYDILHFDGKFFHTLGYLFSKPGFVAKEYVSGKRASYLDPIRMYLFTSAFFFLVFFSMKPVRFDTSDGGNLSNAKRIELANRYQKNASKEPSDSMWLKRIALLLDTTKPLSYDSLHLEDDWQIFNFSDKKYASVDEYKSRQQALAEKDRDGWLTSLLVKQSIRVDKKYGNGKQGVESFFEAFLHKLPYLLFMSLPFFAFILKLLYWRRKNFFYSDHAIFTIYHYIFSFILLLVLFAISRINEALQYGLISFLMGMLSLAWPVYLFLQMKKFYGQGIGKTFFKFLLLNILGFGLLLFLFAVLFIFSIFQA